MTFTFRGFPPIWAEKMHRETVQMLKDTHLHIVELKGRIMALQDDVNALSAQVVKVKDEITRKIADLIASVDALQAQIDAGNNIDLSMLRADIQSLDDIVPDVAPPTE